MNFATKNIEIYYNYFPLHAIINRTPDYENKVNISSYRDLKSTLKKLKNQQFYSTAEIYLPTLSLNFKPTLSQMMIYKINTTLASSFTFEIIEKLTFLIYSQKNIMEQIKNYYETGITHAQNNKIEKLLSKVNYKRGKDQIKLYLNT